MKRSLVLTSQAALVATCANDGQTSKWPLSAASWRSLQTFK